MLLKVLAGLLLTALITFALSNVVLDGRDPEGWWNFVPGMVFYASVWLALILGLVWIVRELVAYPVARWRARQGSQG